MQGELKMLYTKKPEEPYYKNRHSCFLLQYHLVLVTKYRHPVITGEIKDDLYAIVRDTFQQRELNILEFNGEADHIHVLFEADPFTCPGELVNVLKTRTSRKIRQKYGETLLKKWYWKPYFWSDSYFIATVSENSLSVVANYIQNQGSSPTTNPQIGCGTLA